CRLHAGFGSKATLALMDGVAIPDLRDHLRARAAESAVEHANGANGNGGNGATAALPADSEAEASPVEGSEPMGGDGSEGSSTPPSARRTRARGRKKQ